MRFILVALAGLALAACDLGASSPSAEPLPSVGLESMTAHSMDTESSASADASADESATSVTCQEAFASLDTEDLSTVTSLDEASDLLDDTIASCGSVQEWQTALLTVAPMVNLDSAQAFLAARCDESDVLSDAAICDEIDT
ncbi:MAG TPA: hypothetical protein VHK63_06395 [Candidatus Limnocylindria bacterium]|nr:hypothetical protein [Candidatus Limnocylindria bacterium]